MDVLGIDLAKLTFDATLLPAGGAQHDLSFPNTPELDFVHFQPMDT